MSSTVHSGDASPEDLDFEKRVEVVEKDDTEQIARGAVLVPDRLDHQGDFMRADTISDLRDSFTERVENGDAYPGVMHAVFPDDDLELVEDRQLEEDETIGGKDLPAGTWVQAWKYQNDQLWELVDDGVLGGFSIGGTAKGVIYEPGAMPDDVSIPDPVQAELEEVDLSREDIRVREITEGRIMETSTVDHPAVPDAVHAERKALAKAAPALTENVVAARLYLEARGHEPDEARRLAEYLAENKASDGGGIVERTKSFFGFGGGDATAQPSDERAESRAGPNSDGADDGVAGTNMTEDELNEKLDALDTRLDEIDEKLSDTDGDDPDGEEKNDNGPDEPDVEEKVDRLATATAELSEQVEQMAEAQGASQQADQGTSSNEKESVWGDDSPFGGDI